MQTRRSTTLVPGEFGIVLGAELARALGVREGDKVTLIAPGGQVTPAGVVPRLKQFTVVGTFEAGHYEYDSGLVLLHIDDAQRCSGSKGPTGVRLQAARTCTRRARWPRELAQHADRRVPDARLDAHRTATGSPRCRSRSA